MNYPLGFAAVGFPLLFAHRGLRSDYPENTMAAFTACRTYGIPGIELDVHITLDGKVVVIHDNNLLRVANNPIIVEESTYAELLHLDVGSHQDPSFHKERIPLLEDVLQEFGRSTYFDIELKNGVATDRGLAQATAEILHKTAPAMPVLISSFNPLELRRFRAVMPGIATAAIYSNDQEVPWYLRSGLGRIAGKADGYKLHCDLSEHRLKHNRSWTLPWTINDRSLGRQLLQNGAIGLVSDDPRPFLLWQTPQHILSDA